LRILRAIQRKEDIPHLLAAFLAKLCNLLPADNAPQIKNSTLDYLCNILAAGVMYGNSKMSSLRKIVILGNDDLMISDLARIGPRRPLRSLLQTALISVRARSSRRLGEASRKAEDN